jgi:hypothetical protein
MTTMIVEENSAQTRIFVEYARTLPFVKVREDNTKNENAWNEAIAEGVVSVDEFFDEVCQHIKKTVI